MPPMAALLGMLTGIGGGMARDVMLTEIPTVLRAELYAVAALAGAGVVVVGESLDLPSTATTLAGVVLCLGLRLGSIYRGWHLPKVTPSKSASSESQTRSSKSGQAEHRKATAASEQQDVVPCQRPRLN